jgi:TPP-dependent pyruvate/acetoin dehydrogenase alpha subunit
MMQLTHPELLEIYRQLRAIRTFELKIEELAAAGRMNGFPHLSAGQEAHLVLRWRDTR